MNDILMIIYLLLAGVVAGLTSSMAGLASIVSYPVLLSLGLPPVTANVTNTAALIFTGVGTTLSQRPELSANKRITAQVTIWALLGGIVGSLILVIAPAKTFARVVPFLILGAGILMTFSNRRSRTDVTFANRVRKLSTWQQRFISVGKNGAIFLVGVYIGYFGASAGIIMLAIVSFTLAKNFAVSTAIMNFSCFATNMLSLVIYALTTPIRWDMAIVMGIGLFIGGYVGPIVVRHVPVRPMRRIITGLAFVLAAYLFYTAYFK